MVQGKYILSIEKGMKFQGRVHKDIKIEQYKHYKFLGRLAKKGGYLRLKMKSPHVIIWYMKTSTY